MDNNAYISVILTLLLFFLKYLFDELYDLHKKYKRKKRINLFLRTISFELSINILNPYINHLKKTLEKDNQDHFLMSAPRINIGSLDWIDKITYEDIFNNSSDKVSNLYSYYKFIQGVRVLYDDLQLYHKKVWSEIESQRKKFNMKQKDIFESLWPRYMLLHQKKIISYKEKVVLTAYQAKQKKETKLLSEVLYEMYQLKNLLDKNIDLIFEVPYYNKIFIQIKEVIALGKSMESIRDDYKNQLKEFIKDFESKIKNIKYVNETI